MYFNTFAQGLDALDLTGSEDFQNLLAGAEEAGIPFAPGASCRSRNLVLNGLRFHLLEWGTAGNPDVLILHGGNQTAHSWDLVCLALSDRFHVLAVDQRGHGDSEWPRDGDMSIDTMAGDAAALIEALGLRRPSLIAHSMGGRIALQLLSRHDAAARFVIVDIGPEPPPAQARDRIRNFVQAARQFASVDEYVERVTAYEPWRRREQILRTLRYNLMQRSDGTLVSKQFPRYQLADGRPSPPAATPSFAVEQIKCPVLIVRGENSGILSPEAAERFARALPDGTLTTVPACGHNVHTQNTRGFLAAVTPFLAASGPAGAEA